MQSVQTMAYSVFRSTHNGLSHTWSFSSLRHDVFCTDEINIVLNESTFATHLYKHQWRCIFLLIEVLMGNKQQRWITDCYNMHFFCNINFILKFYIWDIPIYISYPVGDIKEKELL